MTKQLTHPPFPVTSRIHLHMNRMKGCLPHFATSRWMLGSLGESMPQFDNNICISRNLVGVSLGWLEKLEKETIRWRLSEASRIGRYDRKLRRGYLRYCLLSQKSLTNTAFHGTSPHQDFSFSCISQPTPAS